MLPLLTQIVFGTLLLTAAATDVRSRRIPNLLTAAVFLCGAAGSWADPAAPRLGSRLAAFALVLVVGTLAWRVRLWGAGDAKLAAAVAAWAGLTRLPAFALATALVGGVLAVMCYLASSAASRRAMRANLLAASTVGLPALGATAPAGRASVPYGVAIAAGGLYAVLGVTP